MKAVFHIDLNDENIFRLALTNAENLLKARPETQTHLLVNGPAVKFLCPANGSDALDRAENLLRQGVSIHVCENALRAFDISKEALLPGCATVPAGVVALIELQQQGCAYIKP